MRHESSNKVMIPSWKHTNSFPPNENSWASRVSSGRSLLTDRNLGKQPRVLICFADEDVHIMFFCEVIDCTFGLCYTAIGDA